MRPTYLAIALAALAAPASAEVLHSGPNSFEIEHVTPLVVPPAQAWAALYAIGGWWNKEHTYSGASRNLSLQLRAGGCFCERIPEDGGGVEHMRVAYVVPGKRLVMTGGLGPLLYEATSGVMDIQIESTGSGSKVTMNYRATGFHKNDAAKTAPLVDKVLGDQMKRLRAFAAGGGGK